MNYEKIYKSFIASRKNKFFSDGYFEIHHILPKSLGGGDEDSNLIKLTAREHFFAHLLLAKIHGGSMWYALDMMRKRSANINSRQYAFLRGNFSRNHSTLMLLKYLDGHTPWNKGTSYTDEHKQKLSNAHKGKKLSAEHRDKVLSALKKRSRDDLWAKNISEGLKGHSVSVETREKISKSLLGNVPYNKGVPDKTITCPHCHVSGGQSIMKRWHFERCKNKC